MRRFGAVLGLAGLVGFGAASVFAQRTEKPEPQESEMTDRLPAVGSAIPDLEIYDEQGKVFRTSLLEGKYTVIVFGCLT